MPRTTLEGTEIRLKLPAQLYSRIKQAARFSGNSLAAEVRYALIAYYRTQPLLDTTPALLPANAAHSEAK